MNLVGNVSDKQEVVGKQLTIGSVTKYPIVKLVIIHEEFCRLSKLEAIVSCVAHTRDVSAYANRMPVGRIRCHHVLRGQRPRTSTHQEALQIATAQMIWWLHTCCRSSRHLLPLAVTVFVHHRVPRRFPPGLSLEIENWTAWQAALPSSD